jgi:sugar lactone lactonase YvrE
MDTLPSGMVVVRNTERGLWGADPAWRVVEEWRLGAMDAQGPEQFGEIRGLAVDAGGFLFVLDGHSQEVRVFDASGAHVRSFGRPGGGPGEIARGMAVVVAPSGDLWVLDPGNARVSVFGADGAYRTSKRMPGSFFTTRWEGGFGPAGAFYSFMPSVTVTEGFRFALTRLDSAMQEQGIVELPAYESPTFDYVSPDGNNRVRTGVPYAPSLRWRFDQRGFIWFAITGEYRVYQRTLAGDTVRVFERPFEPLPVTEADRDSARANLEWFTRQGGKVDFARIPAHKPPLVDVLVDEDGFVWVLPETGWETRRKVVDLFDPEGRYLGRVSLPFAIEDSPPPVIRGGVMYAAGEDELGVPFVVKARIEGRD